ncbi:MAG: nucleotidyltransferase domain-containing protein [Deltaproteobacteria bacterium]|nr:nucleotidyltransferase domain-containing protein [Deltaproteobacteria bacterium]
MYNAELISVLNQYKVSHQAKYGIKRLGLFGSTVRGTATGQSDIDIKEVMGLAVLTTRRF